MMPVRSGCAWALLVQCALAKTVKYMKALSAQGKAAVRAGSYCRAIRYPTPGAATSAVCRYVA